MFERLRTRATAFDRQLRQGLSDEEVTALNRILSRLQHNALGADAETIS
jgi:hypothetical protein